MTRSGTVCGTPCERVRDILLDASKLVPDDIADFILDTLECQEPRYVEVVMGCQFSLNPSYDSLVRRAIERGLINPTGWFLEKTKNSLMRLGKTLPEGLVLALKQIEPLKDEKVYNLTGLPGKVSSKQDREAKKWNVLADYSDSTIDRNVNMYAE